MVQIISDDYALNGVIEAHRSDLIVVDFYADWCGPCRMIAPIFEQLAQKYSKGVLFVKVNVDLCGQTSGSFGVRAMPTFLFLVNGREVDRIQGANAQALEQKIVQHMPGAKSAAAAKNSLIAATAGERSFLETFAVYSREMIIYEDEIARTLALSVIPNVGLIEKSTQNGKVDELQLLKNLLHWFKTEFFKWVDIPTCATCQQTPSKESRTPGTVTPDEMRFGAHVVEVYQCTSCSTQVRFPRYNDPTKLLETREGRCGEWANCFVLCCRAMDFETRFVEDSADHVWCEVWINDLDRWVHCDPCENVCDTPLLYERGWGKKLAYVMAFAIDHVRDVTWRYTFDHKAVLKRRTSCREVVLRNFLKKLNARYQQAMTKDRGIELERRYMKELVEFMSPEMQVRDGVKTEKQGRVTGSDQWKKERGEAGTCAVSRTPVVIRANDNEIASKLLILEYNCANDEYRRGSEVLPGWESLLYKQENIFRKVELDWKMTYLCRDEGAEKGELCWLFDFGDINVRNVEIALQGMAEYNNGKILAIVCSGDRCNLVPANGSLKLDKLDGGKIEIKVTFSGGEGSVAWQHAQLFRTELGSSGPNLVVRAEFA